MQKIKYKTEQYFFQSYFLNFFFFYSSDRTLESIILFCWPGPVRKENHLSFAYLARWKNLSSAGPGRVRTSGQAQADF